MIFSEEQGGTNWLSDKNAVAIQTGEAAQGHRPKLQLMVSRGRDDGSGVLNKKAARLPQV